MYEWLLEGMECYFNLTVTLGTAYNSSFVPDVWLVDMTWKAFKETWF